MTCDPLGEMIATGARRKAGLWSWDGEPLGSLPTKGYKVHVVSFSPDGSRIVTISDAEGR